MPRRRRKRAQSEVKGRWLPGQPFPRRQNQKKTRNWIGGCPNQRAMTYPNRPFLPCSPRVVLLSGVLSVLLSACGGSATGPRSVTPNQEAIAVQNRKELVIRGREAMRRGDSIRAEHYFALALEQGYDPAELLPELLAVCLSSSRLRSALNYAEPYLRKHPKDASLRYLVATVHLGLNQTHAAKQELYTVLRHDSTLADAHFLLGMLEFEAAPIRARQHLAAFLKLRPEGDKASEARERLEQADFEDLSESKALTSHIPVDESMPRAVAIPAVNEEP